jgi:hypothetical protein
MNIFLTFHQFTNNMNVPEINTLRKFNGAGAENSMKWTKI